MHTFIKPNRIFDHCRILKRYDALPESFENGSWKWFIHAGKAFKHFSAIHPMVLLREMLPSESQKAIEAHYQGHIWVDERAHAFRLLGNRPETAVHWTESEELLNSVDSSGVEGRVRSELLPHFRNPQGSLYFENKGGNEYSLVVPRLFDAPIEWEFYLLPTGVIIPKVWENISYPNKEAFLEALPTLILNSVSKKNLRLKSF